MTKRNLKKKLECQRKEEKNMKNNKIPLHSQSKRNQNRKKLHLINYNIKEKWSKLNLRKKVNISKNKIEKKKKEKETNKKKSNMNKLIS